MLKNKSGEKTSTVPSVHDNAFEDLIEMIDKKLLMEKKAFEMSCLIKLYLLLLIDNGVDETVAEKYSTKFEGMVRKLLR